MKNTIFYTWIGNKDRERPNGKKGGPVADALCSPAAEGITRVVLLDDRNDDLACAYPAWLEARTRTARRQFEINRQFLGGQKGCAIDYAWVYNAMRRLVENDGADRRIYLVGPGTPTMAACMLVISRMKNCRGELWQTDEKHSDGVRPLKLPFDIDLIDAPDPEASFDEALSASRVSPVLKDRSMKDLYRKAKEAAHSEYPVLILGPTGSGKEELAKHLHRASGQRKEYKALNCGGLPENLIEAELFGYKKGAFTGAVKDKKGIFEAAGEGTVFLDELGDLPLAQQVRLLRVLQEKEVTPVGATISIPIHCRIVAATHCDLETMVKEGKFREDLYYRLATLVFRIPPLAKRPDDLKALIERFWNKIVGKNPGFPGKMLTRKAHEALLRHAWPGNVRELQLMLVRLSFWADGPTVDESDVQREVGDAPCAEDVTGVLASFAESGDIPPGFNLMNHLRNKRRRWAERALAQSKGKKAEAARLLGCSATHLARLLKE